MTMHKLRSFLGSTRPPVVIVEIISCEKSSISVHFHWIDQWGFLVCLEIVLIYQKGAMFRRKRIINHQICAVPPFFSRQIPAICFENSGRTDAENDEKWDVAEPEDQMDSAQELCWMFLFAAIGPKKNTTRIWIHQRSGQNRSQALYILFSLAFWEIMVE